jgi:hypothetical protein
MTESFTREEETPQQKIFREATEKMGSKIPEKIENSDLFSDAQKITIDGGMSIPEMYDFFIKPPKARGIFEGGDTEKQTPGYIETGSSFRSSVLNALRHENMVKKDGAEESLSGIPREYTAVTLKNDSKYIDILKNLPEGSFATAEDLAEILKKQQSGGESALIANDYAENIFFIYNPGNQMMEIKDCKYYDGNIIAAIAKWQEMRKCWSVHSEPFNRSSKAKAGSRIFFKQ